MAGLSQSEYKSSYLGSSPLTVAQLGLGGVNIVKDPLEMADNELLSAQNAEPYREQGVAGIKKRAGLQTIISNGAVNPIIGIGPPISFPGPSNPDPGSPTITIPFTPTSGPKSPDGGITWTPNAPQTFGDGTLTPNAKYTLGGGSPYEFVTAYPACWCGLAQTYVIGGHGAGQILVVSTLSNVKGVTIFPSSVTADDTLVLPYPYYDQNGKEWAIVVTVAGTAGQCALYAPGTGDVLSLPTFTGNAIATGGVGYGVDTAHWYLWVANGANISSMRPGTDTSWTDTLIGAAGETLLGLLLNGPYLMAGTKQSGTTGPRILRCLISGNTCSVTANCNWTTGGGPTYAFGPFSVNQRMYVIAWGGGATLGGADAGAADSVDQRNILFASGNLATAPNWRATNAAGGLDIQLDASGFNGSSNRQVGPILGFSGWGPLGYWYGWSVQAGNNVMSVARSWYSVNWTYPATPFTVTSNPTWPLMIW